MTPALWRTSTAIRAGRAAGVGHAGAEAPERCGRHRRGHAIPRCPFQPMIDEIAVERVLLFCPQDHWLQEVDVDVVRYADPDGELWEYFSIDGEPVTSPYTREGRPLCPSSGRTTAARLLRRRLVPVPGHGQPRSLHEERPERADAPVREDRRSGEGGTAQRLPR